MIAVSDLELIDNILKWNGTTQTETVLLIENIKEKDFNTTDNMYDIIRTVDDKVPSIFCNNSSKSDKSINNVTDFSGMCSNDYDVFEKTVVTILFLLIVVTVIGNTLIISAVVTTKRLRTVTNCFVTSLAAADLLVGIFVMPPAIAVHISGKLFE
ncbi:jg23636 [Pararge aegeria aegeria]|uniref:Jg23636 protein n=1 Tax=Pararge aegeria aegeria TaxID=348720 RepID=A0A8S4SHB0_9NEOP|nr:jg23636 [Pararge aegeria aegeria]